MVFALGGCIGEPSQIGSDFFRDGSLDISMIDSTTVRCSTVAFDSLPTNTGNRILIGSYPDEKLGRITALGYFQPTLADVEAVQDSHIAFDQLSIVLYYDRYSYYDTAAPIRLNIYQLNEPMKLGDDQFLYNKSAFPTNNRLLGTLAFTPKPHSNDSIEIPLAQTFAAAFFETARNGDNAFESNDQFARHIKGFAIIPDSTGAGSLIGVTTQPELRLYYYDRRTVPSSRRFISFKGSTSLRSTRLIWNRSNTKLKALPSGKGKLGSSFTDNQSYLHGMSGLCLRIDIPYLRDLNSLENFHMTKAVLEIQPVRKSYKGTSPLPESLRILTVNNRNTPYGQYPSDATLEKDLELERDTYYEVDVTEFVKAQRETAELNENGLLFLLPSDTPGLNAERVYFSSPAFNYNTRLKIFFVTIIN